MINQWKTRGNTVIVYSSFRSWSQNGSVLLGYGERVDVKTGQGLAKVQVAKEIQYPEIIKLLKGGLG